MGNAPPATSANNGTRTAGRIRFAAFEVDLSASELRRDGLKLKIHGQPFALLVLLLERPGEVVTREELQEKLWASDTFVDFEHGLNKAVNKLREALGDHAENPRYIETLPRRGYRYIGAVPHVVHMSHPSADTRTRSRIFHSLTAVAILVLAIAVVGMRLRRSRNIATSHAEPSIAVLPFADLSPAHDQDYLSDGLAEEVLDHLSRISNLKVTARTSSFQFKGRNEDTKTIGEKLNVANLLEGSVRRKGNQLRITVQLVKADDGFHLWSDSYDRDVKDLFRVEDEIANTVALALQPRLLPGNSRPGSSSSRTANREAYEAFLHARYFMYMQDEESAKKALDYADKAILLDTSYAPAYALRAATELWSGDMAWADLPQSAERARRDAEKAIGLDPNLADGYRALAMIQSWFELNCRDAEITHRKAVALAPNDPDNLNQSALLAMCQGRLLEAERLWRQTLLLDPLRPVEYQYLAQVLRDLGRYDEAHAALAKAVDLNPKLSMSHEIRGEVYLAQGRPQDALAEMEKETQDLYRDLGEALAYHALGRPHDSDAALSRLIAGYSKESAYQVAQAYAYRGQVDEAFRWLDRAYTQHDVGLLWFRTDLKLKSLLKDPRHAQMLRLLSLSQ